MVWHTRYISIVPMDKSELDEVIWSLLSGSINYQRSFGGTTVTHFVSRQNVDYVLEVDYCKVRGEDNVKRGGIYIEIKSPDEKVTKDEGDRAKEIIDKFLETRESKLETRVK